MQMIMNKEEKPVVEVEKDPSTNEIIDIEHYVEDDDGSIYTMIKWDHKKQKWIKLRFN